VHASREGGAATGAEAAGKVVMDGALVRGRSRGGRGAREAGEGVERWKPGRNEGEGTGV